MIVLMTALFATAQETPPEPPPGLEDEAVVAVDTALEEVAVPDRSRVPDVTPPVLLDLPDIQRLEVSDSVTAYVVPVPGVRKVDVTLWLHRGGIDFEGHVTPVHRAYGWLQDVAVKGMNADDVAVFEDYWDTDVWSSAGGVLRQSVNLSVPVEDLDTAMDLFTSVLTEPAYPGRDVKVYKNEQLRYLLDEAVNSPSAIGDALLDMGWYPADHPYGARPDLFAISGLKRGHLRARHSDMLEGSPISVLVVGDVDPGEVVTLLRERVGDVGVAGEESASPGFSPPGDRRILAVDMPSAEQASVMARMPAPLRDDEDRVAFSALAWAYGGHFMSRINRNLREEKGITYGARARYNMGTTASTFDISVDVPASEVLTAITEIESEISKLVADGTTPDELSAKALEDISWWNSALQTSDSASGFYSRLVLDDDTLDARRERITATRELTPEATAGVAQSWLGEESARLWTLVGPREVIEPQLSDLGIQVEWIEPTDAILGQFE